jgi:hypothetical protein
MFFKIRILINLLAGMAQAGGWTAGTLDSGFMYADGNTASISVANIDHNIKAKEAKGFGDTNATDVDVM